MDGKQLLIPLWYNLESTIHAPGLHGCQQSNVGTRRNYHKEHIQYVQHILLNTPNISSVYRYILICTPCLHTQGTYRRNSLSQEGLVQLTTAVNSPRRSTHHGGQLAAWSTHRALYV
ncbi:hypothetical protein T12_10681 [Trichinella patagoniensis]|nr:hypothetical protein T12_10681 [Trichinella patagoniensis]